MNGPLRVVIAGGGTGGHLYPGLAVAHAIQGLEPSAVITFAGTTRGLEARVVPREGFALDVIRSAGLKGKSLAALVRGFAVLPASAWDAWRVIGRRAPHVVVGVGGYSSGPVVLMAALRRVRTIVLEQNAVPGITNRLLAPVVDAAAVTFPEALPYFGARGFVSGNPVRAGFFRTADRPGAASTTPAGGRVLVFGGSQGALAINRAMMAALPAIARRDPPPAVTHQTGEADRAAVAHAYVEARLAARVDAFVPDLDAEMRAADVVVSRAGATTLAEIAAAGKPAVLVPLPTATDDHQRRNAQALASAGAAEILEQSRLDGATLAAVIGALLDDPGRRARMAEAVRRFARPDAARVVAERVIALAARSARGRS